MSGRAVCVGLATVDLVQRVEEFPRPNEKVTALEASLVVGGPAAGAAVTAAVLGSPVTLLTALGAHPLAKMAATDLTRHGVDVVDADPDEQRPPPISAVSVRDSTGERSVVSRNAQDRVVAPGNLADAVDDADVLLLDGHHPLLAKAAASRANERGIPVVLDGGSWKPALDDLFPCIDLAVCSADFRMAGTSQPTEQGTALLHQVDAVAVTRGADPVLWWDRDGSSGEVPVPHVHPVDTLGAGDVFHGAVVHAMRAVSWRGQLPRVLAFAGKIAAARVAERGRDQWITSVEARSDLRSFG
jgi:sugar/nucleoside kinase (ribokinase family)